MGYVAQPFAVDLNQVRKVLGSKDSALMEKVKECRLYEHYALCLEDNEEERTMDEILEDLFFRYTRPEERKETSHLFGLKKRKQTSGLDPKSAYMYGYALIVICDTLGTYLSEDGDVFYAGKVWEDVNELFKNNGIQIDLDRMWETETLFDIPEIDDFPVISHYSKIEIDYLLKELDKLQIDKGAAFKNSDAEEVIELINYFKEGLKTCQEKNVEWVSFLH
jgi:hypothetical protein